MKFRYNKWYKIIKGEEVPRDLKKRWGETRWQRVARKQDGKIRKRREDIGRRKRERGVEYVKRKRKHRNM